MSKVILKTVPITITGDSASNELLDLKTGCCLAVDLKKKKKAIFYD